MRTVSKFTAIGALLLAASQSVLALEVFTCEAEWAALTRELAPQAKVTSATHALQDPHNIEARPGLIAALRRADLAVCTGASLEAGWLPMLQERSGNARVQDGQPGMFYTALSVDLMDKRSSVGFMEGHVHAEGNPHFHLNPRHLLTVAQSLSERLARLDPGQATQIQARHKAWAQQWHTRIQGWEQQAKPLQGRTVVGQHSTYAYLWAWLGMRQVADLEPKPGVPPTMSHLKQLQTQVAQQAPLAIVSSLYQDEKSSRWLGQQTGVPVLRMSATVTDDGTTATLAGLYDHLIQQLLSSRR